HGGRTMLTEKQCDWVHAFVGIDPGQPLAVASPSPAPGAPAPPADARRDTTNATPAALPEGAQEVHDAIDELEATIKQLLPHGVPAEVLDQTQVTKFRTRYDAATRPATTPKETLARTADLKKLKTAVATAAKDLTADAKRQTTAMTTGATQAIEDLSAAAGK